ncbi:MAG: phosphoribosylformylglycinamidine cyclo-ligase [Candidatus Micrarchaeota archaeon]
MAYSYAKAGVNVDQVKGIQLKVAELLRGTLSKDVIMGAGHYAGLLKVGSKTIAIHTDGVGSKVLVAQALEKYDTVGIDAIAMNVNDLACLGARPIAIVDYLAIEKTDDKMILEIMKGVAKGAKEAKCAVVGGETAIVPDLIKGLGGKGFDLSVTCIGEVEGPMITGKGMKENDAIIGIESSGIHSNGYTLARRVLLKGKNANNDARLKQMLIPTKIYSNAVLEILKKVKSVKGLAHITGGAFSKLQRIGAYSKKGFLLNNMPRPLSIFRQLQKEGAIPEREMYRTFNMGVGFCVVCGGKDAERVVAICKRYNMRSQQIGKIINTQGVYLWKKGKLTNLS